MAGLVASRICHDLISPIGALNNGVELLSGVGGEELALIVECAEAARDTLAFQRLVFGAASEADTVATGEAVRIAKSYFGLKRFTVSWSPLNAAEPRIDVQARLLLLLAAIECAPRGGDAKALEGGETGWLVHGATRSLDEMSERLSRGLTSDRDAQSVSPAEVHMLLLRDALAKTAHTAIVADAGKETLRFSLVRETRRGRRH